MRWPWQRKKVEKSDDQVLADVEFALQEAWLGRHGLTRIWRFIATILIAYLASTAFVQSNERDNCNGSKEFLGSYYSFLTESAAARRDDAAAAETDAERRDNIDTAKNYEQLAAGIKIGLDTDCNDEYPIVPLLGI